MNPSIIKDPYLFQQFTNKITLRKVFNCEMYLDH